MLSQKVGLVVDHFSEAAQRLIGGRHATIKLTLLWVSTALFLAFPDWLLILRHSESDQWKAVLAQAQQPLATTEYPAASHSAKMALRLVPPSVGNVFGLGVGGLLAFSFAAYVVFALAASKLMLRVADDVATATFGALILAASMPGAIAASDANGFFDATAFAFLALAMLTRHPLLIVLLGVLAGFTDERAILALPFLFLFHATEAGIVVPWTLRRLAYSNIAAAAVFASALVYAGLRIAISRRFGLYTPHDPAELGGLVAHFSEWGISFWSALEGGWFVVAAGVFVLAVRREYWVLALSAAATLVLTTAGWTVIDMSRSLTYLFPLFLLMAGIVSSAERQPRALFFHAMLVSLIFPTYNIMAGDRPFVMIPLPLVMLRTLFEGM